MLLCTENPGLWRIIATVFWNWNVCAEKCYFVWRKSEWKSEQICKNCIWKSDRKQEIYRTFWIVFWKRKWAIRISQIKCHTLKQLLFLCVWKSVWKPGAWLNYCRCVWKSDTFPELKIMNAISHLFSSCKQNKKGFSTFP